MSDTPTRQFTPRFRYALALGAGLLLAAAFPKIGIAGFAWIAPGLMLGAALDATGKHAFRMGYVGGLAFWLASLYWLLLIPVKGFPILGWIALSAYLALFQAFWVWLCWKWSPARPTGSAPLSRMRWSLLCAALWVALELIRARFLTGFPWSLLGVSQFEMTPLLQISSVTGVYGVSFLVVWTSVSLLCGTLTLATRRRGQMDAPTHPAKIHSPRYLGGYDVFAPLLAIATVFATGYYRITHAPESARSIHITTIQPSIPQTMIWDWSANDARFADLIALSERALSNQTDVLLWPEAALPEFNDASFMAVTNLAAQHKVWFIFGADHVMRRPGATNDHDVLVYNGAWMLSPRGLIADNYHKRRLVIFGEYVPLADVLPFVKWFTPITGGFAAGTNTAQFHLRDLDIKAAPLICFEDCFPQAREHVADDTDLLVNLTNDGWFGESAEQWQHAANAVFRAIENDVPLVRSCNNGLTCWIDPRGRIRNVFRDERDTIYGAGFATFSIPLPPKTRPATFYNRHGDVFAWACMVLSVVAVASIPFQRKNCARSRSNEGTNIDKK